jgi:dynein regulatory complex protein 1
MDVSRSEQAKIDMKWDSSKKLTDPLSISERINEAKVLYDQILSSKDNLIMELRKQLEDKDHEYMNALQNQRQEIGFFFCILFFFLILDNMILTMRQTYREVVEEYQNELENLEGQYDKEREEQLEVFRQEIDNLLDKRRKQEVTEIEEIRKTRETYTETLEKMRQRAIESYNDLNLQLETEIQDLEQQHAQMRATVQLNQQKLQYNVKVMGARAKENSLTKSSQQAKAARVSEALASIKEKLAQTTQMYKDENQRLTAEYKRVTENFKEFQTKFRHFELTDEKQFQVWKGKKQNKQKNNKKKKKSGNKKRK